MIAKEWRDARWKLALGALAFLVVAVVALRSYEEILAGVDSDGSYMEREFQKPVRLDPTATPRDEEIFKRQMREDVEEMREPGYPAKAGRVGSGRHCHKNRHAHLWSLQLGR